jgi:flagellin FlaB
VIEQKLNGCCPGRVGGMKIAEPGNTDNEKEEVTMKGRCLKALGNVHRGEKGITGLETAIILIAFVTVAAVLAYSVLSAGIFSSERGKEAVYSGLESAKASMEVSGNVYANSSDGTTVDYIQYQVASVLADDDVDLAHIVMNYQDDAVYTSNITWYYDIIGGSGTMLGPNEVADISVNVSAISGTTLIAYEDFTLEMIPTSGAAIQLKRTLPGDIVTVMNLH